MKKLLLTSFLCIFVISGAFAQIRWSTNTGIGQELKAANTSDKDTLLLNFKNDVSFTTVSTWAPAKATANIGKDSVYKKTLQTQKGIQVKAFLDNTTTTAYEDGSFKCNNAGGNGNPGRFASIDSLKGYLTKSIITGTINGNTNDSLSRPAACLFNVGTDEIAFGMYPGKATKIEYIYRFDYTSKACTDDISFDISTYDLGTTGKTATYGMRVYKSSTFTPANAIGDSVANLYTTGDLGKTVNVAAAIGVTPADLSNKSLYIVIKTLGTNGNALPNAVDANNIPVVYDPTIVFDNFFLTYASASWAVPSGAIASAVFNHNNGSPVYVGQSSTDYSGGTAVPAYTNDTTKITINLVDINRIGAITIKEANDGGSHSSSFAFTNTGSVKKKINGVYTDIAYTYVPYNATTSTAMSLTIPAPSSGSVNDTLQIISSAVNIPSTFTRTVRYEIDNGVRFWYNVGVVGSLTTGSNYVIDLSKIVVTTNANSIYVSNTADDVKVYNIQGQLLKAASPEEAANGISVKSGLYIVKTGYFVQKVLVK